MQRTESDALMSAVLERPERKPRQLRRALHGVLLLDKPLGLSSNDALQKAKYLLRALKAGHTGTLDPLATGLLPLCFGAATKFSQISLDADKAYVACMKLGITTSTGDAEGDIVQTRAVELTLQQIQQACAAFVGQIEQIPPMYSALKHEGRALYEYARRGITVERPPRRVTIHGIEVLDWHKDLLTISVACSKGSYIRTLAEDIGERLGCGAHLSTLRRTRSGPLNVDNAITLEALADLSEAQRESMLLPVDSLLSDWPRIQLEASEAGRFLTGLRRRVDAPDAPKIRVYGPQTHAFLGSAHITAGELIADRLLNPMEVAGLPHPESPL